MSKINRTFYRILSITPILLGLFSSIFFISGCSANNPIAINSEEDFFNMENKYYKLNCDLDLYGKIWTPLKVKGFIGDGHTISGLMIGSTDYWYSDEGKLASLFLTSEKVENVTINRCTLVASDVETISIVGIDVKSYENVKVQKCTITSTISKSPEWHILSAAILNSSRITRCTNISNCSISDCNVSLSNNTSYTNYLVSGFNDGFEEGIRSGTFSDCSIKNCVFEVKSEKANVSFGGICAQLPISMEDNSIKASQLKMDSCQVTINAKTVKAGGIFGSSYRLSTTSLKEFEGKNIVSSNNAFDIKAESDLLFGGIAGRFDGTLNNALSKSNHIYLSNSNKGTIYVGGALGNGALNTKYTVCDNNDFSIGNLKTANDKDSYFGGIVGKQNGTLMNSFIAFKESPSNFNEVSQVCQQSSLNRNIYIYNGLDNSEYTSLDNKDDFIDRLSLGSEWSIKDGEIDLSF